MGLVTSRRALEAALVLDDLTMHLTDHARGPFFVRSRRHAHVHPRHAIRLCAGALCGSHQQSHIHSKFPELQVSLG